ncbi:MAG: PDZ domain-containing protein [Chloroflexi bacterium]|nr:PDZ domain-containing protein [Chloroflexota bacterium]
MRRGLEPQYQYQQALDSGFAWDTQDDIVTNNHVIAGANSTSVTVTPQIAQAMNLSTGQQGVLVEQVVTGSPANKAGLKGSFETDTINGGTVRIGGDVIVAVDGQAVTSVSDLQNAIAQDHVGQTVTLTVLRSGEQVDVSATLAPAPGQTS